MEVVLGWDLAELGFIKAGMGGCIQLCSVGVALIYDVVELGRSGIASCRNGVVLGFDGTAIHCDVIIADRDWAACQL